MMKIRNYIFCGLICLFLIGPTFLFVCAKAGIDIPKSLTAEPAKYLSGGESDADVASVFNLEGFETELLQDAIENDLGNYIPCKLEAITLNAELQRQAISISNGIFQWECYPTYYSSSRIFIPEQNALSYLPVRMSEDTRAHWRSFASGISEIAQENTDKRIVLYVVEAYSEPSYNPAYELTSNPRLPSDCIDAFASVCKDQENVRVLSQSYSNGEAFYECFFTTDHHWNADGAFAAYYQICEELELRAIEKKANVAIPDYGFIGATARWGIDLLEEQVYDCENDFSFLTVLKTGGETVSGNDHSAFYEASSMLKPYCFYDSYYDNFGDCMITGGDGNRRALLIGNSYRGALQRPLASSYGSLTVRELPKESQLEFIADQIRGSGADDVVIVANPSDFVVD